MQDLQKQKYEVKTNAKCKNKLKQAQLEKVIVMLFKVELLKQQHDRETRRFDDFIITTLKINNWQTTEGSILLIS